jgi:hypothetical protein
MADVFPGVEYVPSTLDALRAAITDVSVHVCFLSCIVL